MVLCAIRVNDHPTIPRRFQTITHTGKNLAPRGITKTKAKRQIRHVHDYYLERDPLRDSTVRDCTPGRLATRRGTRQRRQPERYSPTFQRGPYPATRRRPRK